MAHAKAQPLYDELLSKLPFACTGGTTVVALGSMEGCNPKRNHVFKFLFPGGFKSTKVYADVLSSSPGATVIYDSAIVTGPDGSHTFLTDRRGVGWGVRANTAGKCWAEVHKEVVGRGRGEEVGTTPPPGPEAFGFGLMEVLAALEGMPGTAACSRYYFLAQRKAGARFPPPPGAQHLLQPQQQQQRQGQGVGVGGDLHLQVTQKGREGANVTHIYI